MRSTLTLILTILATFCQGECPIECYCDRVTTCTGDKLLTRFPFTEIYASYSSSPSPLEPLTRLELHEYGVNYLSRSDFLQIISNLTELSLSRNSLERVDNATFSLSSFQQDQDQAKTTSLSASILTSRSRELSLSLRILDLSQNNLKYFVGGGALKRLRVLDLSSNKLQQVYGLSAIENVESVNLRANRISHLQPATFQNLKYLQYINLDSNALALIDPSTFSNLPALAHLILSSNPVSNLGPGFYWDSRVQFIDVSHVGLTSVPFSLTKTVRDFRCANNNLTIIRQTEFESYPNVGLLVLDENAIEVVEDDAFGRLEFLTRLWMNGNRLRRVPQNLPPSLQSLHLEENLIASLSPSDFSNLRRLEELNLHSNRISSLPPFIFAELISLRNLDLRSNSIDVIYKDSLSNLSSLYSLDVSQNPLKVIVTGAFAFLGKLSLLHLSRLMDPIEFDTSSFSPLQKLQIFELDDSPHFAQKLIQDSTTLSGLPSLRELNLARCGLEDIVGVSHALAELNLQAIRLAGNPWDCHHLLNGSAFQQLIKEGVIVDQPECQQPKPLKGVSFSSLNFSALEEEEVVEVEQEEEEESILDFTELTPELGQDVISYMGGGSSSISISDSGSDVGSVGSTNKSLHTKNYGSTGPGAGAFTSLDKVTNAPNTNSPENPPHALDANVNPFRSTLFPKAHGGLPNSTLTATFTSSTEGLATKNLPSIPANNISSMSNSTSTNVNASVGPMSRTNSINATKPEGLVTNLGGNDSSTWTPDRMRRIDKNGDSALTDSSALENTEDPVPTRSYFDSSWKGETNSISSPRSGGSGNKKPPISINIARTGSPDKTKTNDDNTIIDEDEDERGRRGGAVGGDPKRYHYGPDEEESIDGFPSYSDVDGRLAGASKKLPTSTSTAILRSSSGLGGGSPPPKAFYLRRESQQGQDQEDSTNKGTGGGAIIVKTLLISATACLVSILLLLSVAYAMYKMGGRRRAGSGLFSCPTVINRGLGDDSPSSSDTGRMCYTRFGRRKPDRGSNQHQEKDFDSELDTVELSGITNRLYCESKENEEIYHIT